MFLLSIVLDYKFILSLHLIATVAMFVMNLSISMYFKKKIVKTDNAFKHWSMDHPKAIRGYTIISALLNFKLLRGLYSHLFKSNLNFKASFEDCYDTLVKPLFVSTIVNLFVQVIPVLIIDIYTIIFIPWGY
jgi:hypothetical protein